MTGMWASCSYRQFQPWMGIPVRTSLGTPKWTPGYELVHAMREVTPRPDMLSLDYDDYRRRYRHKLHRQTIGRVLAAADRIRREAGADPDVPLVLLCYENLGEIGQWCHRTMLGEWLRQQAGIEVFEYGDLLVAQPVPQPQPVQEALFSA